MHQQVMQTVLSIVDKNPYLSKSEHRTLWRKLFVDGILKLRFTRPQFWVIDAMDECKNSLDLVTYLLKAAAHKEIRIFVTSRDSFESYQRESHSPLRESHPKYEVISEQIQTEDINEDIILYLNANRHQLPEIDEETRQSCYSKILNKSNGCFLWVRLILEELRKVRTGSEVSQVLDDVPSNMTELYTRILDSYSKRPHSEKLTKSILKWAVCSIRQLTADEMHHAHRLDMQENHIARDFLLKASKISEFGVDRRKGHRDLTLTCLEYLKGHELKSIRHRALSPTCRMDERCSFITYAGSSFFEHLQHVDPIDEDVLYSLAEFLESANVLSWIEHVAKSASLSQLILAGKAFKNFLKRRSRSSPMVGKEVNLIDTWSTDLVRLATKFGANLVASPSSIHRLIPPFCPADSAPRKQFGDKSRSGITVLGLNATWNDCLSKIVHSNEAFTALACSRRHFAIGTSSGKILIHNGATCQEVKRLIHGEHLRNLLFGKKHAILAATGIRTVRIWSTSSWQQMWQFETSELCMSIAFAEEVNLMLGAFRDNSLQFWNLQTGSLEDSTDWTKDNENENPFAYRRPMAADFCLDRSLLAVVYRSQDIFLWNIEDEGIHGFYCRGSGARPCDEKRTPDSGAVAVRFSLAPATNLVAASYFDGDLVLFNFAEGAVVATAVANAHVLASSPDGRILACGNSNGMTRLYDFETLKLLYSIDSDDYGIRDISFSGDGYQLLDIRGAHCSVWNPTVLIREELDEESSDVVSVSTGPQEVNMEQSDNVVEITSIACHPSEDVFFVGKEDGSVYVYETTTGRRSHQLYCHGEGVSVVSLQYDGANQSITSAGTGSRVLTRRLTKHHHHYWEIGEVLFDHREDSSINQALSYGQMSRILVSTVKEATLWSVHSQGTKRIKTIALEVESQHQWLTHPQCAEHLIQVNGPAAYIYDWRSMNLLTRAEGVSLEADLLQENAIRSAFPCFNNLLLATALRIEMG